MNGLNCVEVNKIQVTPLSEWKYLIAKVPLLNTQWPLSSDKLCWWCCHRFPNIPAFLPVSVDIDVKNGTGTLIFTGNFCSWNCVKRYAWTLDKNNKMPDGCHYIGLLAYITVSKGNPCDGQEMHELGLCDCLLSYKGVSLPPNRECLESFGGNVSIDTYRQGFHAIREYGCIERNFSVIDIDSVQSFARKSPHLKYWGFKYLHYAGPDASYTTVVNVLPLTNRTFDKKTLVTTGNEMAHAHLPTSTATTTTTTTQQQGKKKKPSKNPPPPRPNGRGIGNRRNNTNKANHLPLPLSLNSSSSSSPPSHRIDQIGAATSLAGSESVMSDEQVLSCNDEQMFYTNSLRGYGNILTSMGIEISRPGPTNNVK